MAPNPRGIVREEKEETASLYARLDKFLHSFKTIDCKKIKKNYYIDRG